MNVAENEKLVDGLIRLQCNLGNRTSSPSLAVNFGAVQISPICLDENKKIWKSIIGDSSLELFRSWNMVVEPATVFPQADSKKTWLRVTLPPHLPLLRDSPSFARCSPFSFTLNVIGLRSFLY